MGAAARAKCGVEEVGAWGHRGVLAASLSLENNGGAGGHTIWLTCCQNSTSMDTQEHVVEE